MTQTLTRIGGHSARALYKRCLLRGKRVKGGEKVKNRGQEKRVLRCDPLIPTDVRTGKYNSASRAAARAKRAMERGYSHMSRAGQPSNERDDRQLELAPALRSTRSFLLKVGRLSEHYRIDVNCIKGGS